MGLRRYLKINQLFAKLKSLDNKLDKNDLGGVETDLKGIGEKIDSLSRSGDLNHENIREIQNKIDSLDSNYRTNCDTTNNHVLAVNDLVQGSATHLNSINELANENARRITAVDELVHEGISHINAVNDLAKNNSNRINAVSALVEESGNRLQSVNDLVAESNNRLQSVNTLVQDSGNRLQGIADEIHAIKQTGQNVEALVKDPINKEFAGVCSKLDTIYNNLLSLNNNVSKKDYIINDDRLEILKNLIKDERASNICVDMRFLGSHLSMRIDDSDIRVFKQIFVDNEYDSLNLPETANTIVDLGANIGLSALFFLKKYPNAHIIAVEPDTINFEFMKRNLEDYSNHVALIKAAIWPSDGEVSLVEHDESNEGLGAWGYRTETLTEGAEGSVSAISIPTLMNQFSMDFIDILKVDIEGAEYELFEKDYESWLDKVGLIIIETHDRFKPNSEAMVRNALNGRFTELPLKGENLFFKKNS